MVEQIEIDPIKLSNLVRQRPVLWDRHCPGFKSRTLTIEEWQDLSAELCGTAYHFFTDKEQNDYARHVMRKWTNLKDHFMKNERRIIAEAKFGRSVKKYIHYDQLSFLRKNIDHVPPRDMSALNNNSHLNFTGNIYLPRSRENVDDRFPFPGYINANENLILDEETDEPPYKKYKLDEIDVKLLQSLDTPEDRHISFFKSILPSLLELNSEETLKFQMSVLKILQDINKSRDFTINLEAESSTSIDI